MSLKELRTSLFFAYLCLIGQILVFTIHSFGPTGSYSLLGVGKGLKMWQFRKKMHILFIWSKWQLQWSPGVSKVTPTHVKVISYKSRGVKNNFSLETPQKDRNMLSRNSSDKTWPLMTSNVKVSYYNDGDKKFWVSTNFLLFYQKIAIQNKVIWVIKLSVSLSLSAITCQNSPIKHFRQIECYNWIFHVN